jgi:simple sugar transport system permease protein
MLRSADAKMTALKGFNPNKSIMVVFIAIFSLFMIGNPEVFTSFDIYRSFKSTIPFFGILALALTFVITLGEMDLSFPSVMALSAFVLSKTFDVTGNLFFAIILCLLTGVACGLLNSFLTVKIGIPSLVATVSTMFLFRGLVNIFAAGEGISLVQTRDTMLRNMFVGRIAGEIPAQMIWMILLGILCYMIFNRHKFGSHVSFVGDNKDSAIMMGIDVGMVKTLVFAQMGFFAALSSIMLNLEVTYFWPGQGEGYLLTTIASVFIGGTSVFGGKGTIIGTFIGALIIGSLEAGIIAIGLSGFWVQLVYGLILMISLSVYSTLTTKAG